MPTSKIATLFVILLAASGALYCSEPSPVTPITEKASVVIADRTTRWVYEVGCEDLVVDSTQLTERPLLQVVSSGRTRRMYVPLRDSVAVIDIGAESGTSIWPTGVEAGVVVSRGERYVALLGNDLRILRSSDWTVVFHDTSAVFRGCFSLDENRFYAVVPTQPSGRKVLQIVVADSSVSDMGMLPEGGLPQIIASQEQGRFYLYFSTGAYTSKFVHYDVTHDTVLYERTLQPGDGSMAVTPDEQYLFYTSPGQIIVNPGAPMGWPYIGVYDCRTHQALADISTAGVYDTSGQSVDEYIKLLQVTSDGKWLVGLSIYGKNFALINTSTASIQTRASLGTTHTLNSLTTHPSAQ